MGRYLVYKTRVKVADVMRVWCAAFAQSPFICIYRFSQARRRRRLVYIMHTARTVTATGAAVAAAAQPTGQWNSRSCTMLSAYLEDTCYWSFQCFRVSVFFLWLTLKYQIIQANYQKTTKKIGFLAI